MEWLGQQFSNVKNAIVKPKDPRDTMPQVEPNFQDMTKEQQDRWAATQTPAKSSFWPFGGAKKPKKPKKPKTKKNKKKQKQTKNKRN